MAIPEEMERVIQEILRAYDERMAGVASIRAATMEELAEFQAAHQEMAAEQRQRLTEDRARLASDVAAMRGGFRQELDEARRTWRSLATRQRRARKPSAPPQPPPPPVAIQATPVAGKEEVAGDDLTVIRGIGPGMQSRLNRAGIYTYAQLAARIPEDLRQLLGEAGRMASVEEWIEQARKLAGTS